MKFKPEPSPSPSAAPVTVDDANALPNASPYGNTTKLDLPVYWGKPIGSRQNPFKARSTSVFDHPPEGDFIELTSTSKAKFYRWTDAERNAWGDHLAAVGLIAPEDTRNWDVLRKYWEAIVDETANSTAAGGKLDPFQMTDKIAGVGNGGGNPQAGEAKFTGRKTQTSSSAVLTDSMSAKALVNDALSAALGRAATDQEVSAFTATLNSAERSNPVNTTTTQNIVDDELKSQSSISTGGLDAAGKAQILKDEAMKKPDYGAYQASTYFFNALTSAIQSPVHVN
jgi:hypothetical protein